MIKINLARKRRQETSKLDLKNLNVESLIAALRNVSGGGGGERKKIDFNSPVAKILMGIALIYLVEDTLTGYRVDSLKGVEQQIAVVEKDRLAVLDKLQKIKGFEPIKKQLEDDERSVRTKLEVVTQLLENRNLPAKMLMQIAQVIPQEVWLTSLSLTSEKVVLGGGTPGHNEVSDFIKALSGTAYFADVTLKGIQENTTASKDQKFQSFDLEAKRR